MIHFWPIVLAIGFGTYLARASFIVFAGGRRLPEACMGALRFIPPAVMSALIVPSVVMDGGQLIAMDALAKPLAALIAGFVAWKTKNVLATIGVGMLAFWALGWILVELR